MTAEVTILDLRGQDVETLLLHHGGPASDATLFARLSSMAASPERKKVLTLDLPRGGRGKIERVKERRYPTAFDYDSKTGEPTPKEFETRNLGTSIDLQIDGPQPTAQFSVEIDGQIVTEAKEPLKYPLSLLPDTP